MLSVIPGAQMTQERERVYGEVDLYRGEMAWGTLHVTPDIYPCTQHKMLQLDVILASSFVKLWLLKCVYDAA